MSRREEEWRKRSEGDNNNSKPAVRLGGWFGILQNRHQRLQVAGPPEIQAGQVGLSMAAAADEELGRTKSHQR